MAIFNKAEAALTSVITVDAQTDTIGFYTMNDSDRDSIQGYRAKCKVGVIDDAFLSKFDEILKRFCEKYPQVSLQKTALVLPDYLFLLDTVKVPAINRKAVNQSLELTVQNLYKNSKDLLVSKDILLQNRQQITSTVCGVRKDALDKLKAVCNENKVGVQGVTFAANAAVCGAAALNPKLKNETYLLLDIKESSARFVFVVKGKTVGYYSLPFGYGMMRKNRVAAEDALFDHTSGELLVLNAKERAKAKRLTMIDTFAPGAEEELNEGDELMETAEGGSKGRRLPKFMLRPTPQSDEEYVYENFRLFVKWALELIASNPGITAAGMPEAVYVNMPEEFEFLFDMVNAEQEENKVAFAPLLAGADEKIAGQLELFGGLHINRNNKNCTF